ncbi:MAG: hypothetical protein K2X46_15850 [Roseomonas sp.]|nr:hypothetical protein [Roseomonas sp.]
MSEERICVYTVLLGDYEALNEQPLARASSLPFICLTDSPTLRSASWECRLVESPLAMDAVRSQRDIKIRPHRYLPEFDGSIYIDNSVVLDRPADALWAMHNRESGFTLARHSGRETLLDEFVAVMRLGLDDGARVAEQFDHLLLAEPAVLAEPPWWGGMLLRHHHRKDLVDLAEAWAAHVLRYSRRDQLSLNGVLARRGLRPGILPIDNGQSPFHHWPVRVAARKRSRAADSAPAALPHLLRQRMLEEREAAVARAQQSVAWQCDRAARWLSRTLRQQADRALRPVSQPLRRALCDAPVLGRHFLRAEMVRRYRRAHLVAPRLDPPVTFNEHVVARILHDRDPRLKVICDKLAVREFIRDRVGDRFTVPLLGVWSDAAAIDWARLPARFALKPNHASGPVALVGAGSTRDVGALAAQAAAWLAVDYYDVSFEWGYRGIPRRLLAEPLLEATGGGPPPEIYVYVFGGSVALIRVLEGGKLSSARRDSWFGADGSPIPVRLKGGVGSYEPDLAMIRDVVAIAETLAAGFTHLRVDLMLTSAGLLVSELTAYSHAGNAMWQPRSWDERLGRLWTMAAAGQRPVLEPCASGAGAGP